MTPTMTTMVMPIPENMRLAIRSTQTQTSRRLKPPTCGAMRTAARPSATDPICVSWNAHVRFSHPEPRMAKTAHVHEAMIAVMPIRSMMRHNRCTVSSCSKMTRTM
jgi:hypothetical protein